MGSSRAVVEANGRASRLVATQTRAVGRSTGLPLLSITRNGNRTGPGTNEPAPAVTATSGPGRFSSESIVPREDEPQAETTPAAIRSTATTRPTGPSLAMQVAPSRGCPLGR